MTKHCQTDALRSLVWGIATLLIGYSKLAAATSFPTVGEIIRYDPKFDNLFDKNAKVEVLTMDAKFTEGPVWVPEANNEFGGYILFSDLEQNVIFKWQEGEGLTTYMNHSGYTGVADYGSKAGSNGLGLDALGRLIICEHGDRRVSVLTKNGGKMTLADNWQGKRFNSPNDLAIHSSGDIYFTDPPYGLPSGRQMDFLEIDFSGIYRIKKNGEVVLLHDGIVRANGIAFSPDEKRLFVSSSHGKSDPIWRVFPVKEDGNLGEPREFFNAAKDNRIMPVGGDGLTVDLKGNVFASNLRSLIVISPEGELLGQIITGKMVSNVCWGNDGSVLYITSHNYLCRIKTTTKGTF